ncbi:MAG: ribose-5-phosphate isomerase RpiA [Pseudomonadota bacterium]
MTSLQPSEAGKFAAARAAVDLVADGMTLGLGTGSTASLMVRALAVRARAEKLTLTCVPTSTRTADLARSLGLNVVTLDEAGWLDLTIDGADEFDPSFNLIKGGGGAHLQEKIVAAASDRLVVITDPSKEVAHLGNFPLPIEVTPFGRGVTHKLIDKALKSIRVSTRATALRMAGDAPYVTDEGNHIIDASLTRIDAPQALAEAMVRIPGVVETGLFLGMCDTVIIGRPNGVAEIRGPRGTEKLPVEMAEYDALP